ncbi:MAG: HEPN domain-containing protein [Patescibacteria group bacterium]|jgi:uncharacterized protein (UPF0332 family)
MKKTLENLAKAGFLQKEKGIRFDQIIKRIERAGRDLLNAKLLIGSDKIGAYRMAYDAMLQAGIALVFFYGYRPKVKGFHKTVVESAEAIIGASYSSIIKEFDQMRKNRHEIIYDVGIVSDTEADESIKTAENFIGEIKNYINKHNPQKKLL